MLPSGGNPNFDGAPHRRRLVSGPSAPPLSHNSSSSDSHMTESSGMMIPMNQHDALAYQNTPNMGMAPMGMAQAEQEWWSATGYMPSLNTSMDQMAELQLQQTQSHSPITVDDYAGRRSSIHSNSDLADWQEKVRVERRKVQNRAAQRAYRERKEKALTDLRDMLDKKDSQFQALQKDHRVLQEQYKELLAAKQGSSALSVTPTLAPTDLISSQSLHIEGRRSFQQDRDEP